MGKDSMSGTFQDIDVPPTLVSFAVDVAEQKDIITPELKAAGNKLVWLHIDTDEYDLPVYESVMEQYGKFRDDVQGGKIVSAYTLDRHGIAAAVSKMAFGNGMGVEISTSVEKEDLFACYFGDIIAEVPASEIDNLTIAHTVIGEVTDKGAITYGDVTIGLDEAVETWKAPLEKVFATTSGATKSEPVKEELFNTDKIYVCKNKVAQPTVFIPVFPGTSVK